MKITLVENPPHVVNLNSKAKNTQQEYLITKVAVGAIYFLQSVVGASWQTFKTSGTSFKHIVLGYYGNRFRLPSDPHLTVFKIVYWVFAMGLSTGLHTFRLTAEKLHPGPKDTLQQYAGHEQNIQHLQVKELSLNTSSVPESVTVDHLAILLDKINFTDPDAPGYMTELSRKEGAKTYSVDELKQGIETFIAHVKERRPFLGTPPAYDTPRLMAFYQQIEDAVRLSIHAVETRLANSKAKPGSQEQKDLLEDRARVALDLAIAGFHCGGRYMGDSMQVYYSACREENATNWQTLPLNEVLGQILAQKRTEIAKELVGGWTGSNTHAYSQYFGSLGRLVGVPGTKNMTEALFSSFDVDATLASFFKKYTVDTIISTINDAVKNNQSVREKIGDWARDQINAWHPADFADKKALLEAEIPTILADRTVSEKAMRVAGLYNHLITTGTALPKEEEWDDFVNELFALPEVKATVKEENHMKKMRLLNNLKMEWKDPAIQVLIQPALVEKKGLDTNIATADKQVASLQKCLRENLEIPLDKVTCMRLIEGKELTADAFIANTLDTYRRIAFAQELEFENMEENGLSAPFMEWLLVTQGILHPQGEPVVDNAVSADSAKKFSTTVLSVFKKNTQISDDVRNEALALWNDPNTDRYEERINALMNESGHELRYRGEGTSAKARFLNWVFKKSYETDSKAIREAAGKAGLNSPVHQFCWIQLPTQAGRVMKNPLFALAAGVVAFVATRRIGNFAFDKTSAIFAGKVIPWAINNASKEVMFVFNRSMDVLETCSVWRGRVVTLLALNSLTNFIPSRFHPNFWFNTLSLSHESKGIFLFTKAFTALTATINGLPKIGLYLQGLAQRKSREQKSHLILQGGKLLNNAGV